jgi:hypothetical protein
VSLFSQHHNRVDAHGAARDDPTGGGGDGDEQQRDGMAPAAKGVWRTFS